MGWKLKVFSKRLMKNFHFLESIFDIEGKKRQLAELDVFISRDDFWQDVTKAREILKKKADLAEVVEKWVSLRREADDSLVLLELAEEENDEETLQEVVQKVGRLKRDIRMLELEQLMRDEQDVLNAIVSIHAGAGGTEAQDWAEMLLRMYLRWSERKGFKVEMVDMLPGEEAGIKSVTFTVAGKYAYGFLKSESGIHRLVRISPFDASGRRHTSFAAVFVYPEVNDEIVIDIKPSDLRIETFRASGAGGQHVNKTSSAVRITHIPTGIVVSCQNEKSQHRNREIAMKILRSRLYERELRKRQEKFQEIHNNLDDISWGNQIRSYILQPYRLVKDHRTNVEKGDVDSVLDGEIDAFIEAFLLKQLQEKESAKVAVS
jgi:peptide chain release factor 2